MRETTCGTTNYSAKKVMGGCTCSLCGKPGSVAFKNAFVCEDCLNYVKLIAE